MKMKINRCKLDKNTQRKLVEFFVAEVTARTAANLLDIQPNTAALFYRKIREIIMYHLDQTADDIFEGEVELDESYFGGTRKGKRGRGAGGKVAVFGILKRGGMVYVKVVPDTKSDTLMPVITRKVAPDSVVYTDSYRSYNVL
ncbi:transposase, partial [Acinetobacter baumannii ABNIH22]